MADLDGVIHTVEVTAETLYEAVALGLAAVRDCPWAAEIGQGLHTVTVRVTDVSAEHTVMFADFNKWLEDSGGYPRDMTRRDRVRKILGLSKAK
jgi:hypothetical protein